MPAQIPMCLRWGWFGKQDIGFNQNRRANTASFTLGDLAPTASEILIK